MSIRRFAALVLALVVSACASSGGTSATNDSEIATASLGGNSRLITRAQFEEYPGEAAVDVVRRFNSRWLRGTRGSGFSGRPNYAKVVVDGIPRGDLEELTLIRTESVERMRFISAAEATTQYGTGYAGGVIEVTTRGLGGR